MRHFAKWKIRLVMRYYMSNKHAAPLLFEIKGIMGNYLQMNCISFLQDSF